MAKKKNKKKVTSKKKPVTKNKTNKKDISGTTSQDTKLTFINHLVVVDRALKNHIRKIESLKTQNYSKSQLLRYLDKMLFEIDIVITKSEVFIKKHPSCSKLAGEARILLGLMNDDLLDGYMALEVLRSSKGCYELTIDAYRAAYRYGGDLKKIAGQLFNTARKKDLWNITYEMLLRAAEMPTSMGQTDYVYTPCDDLSRIAELLLIKVDEKPLQGETVNNYISLRNFMKLHCEKITPDKLKSAKRVLLRINKDILPLPKKKDKKNSPFKYKENELIANWPKLRKINPSLPELKL